MPFLKPFDLFLPQLYELDGHTTLPCCQGKNIILADLVVISLAIIKIIYVLSIKKHPGLFAEQVHGVKLSFPFPVTKTIGCVTMKDQFFIEAAVGTQVKPKS